MTKHKLKSFFGIFAAIIVVVAVFNFLVDRAYVHDKEQFEARLAKHFILLTHYARKFVRNETEYQIYQINYFDQISKNSVAPKDHVYAFVNYNIRNLSKETRRLRIEPCNLITSDGNKFAPDPLGMGGFDGSYITHRGYDGRPYTETLSMKPGEQRVVFAVYLIPKSQATENSRLLYPDEADDRSGRLPLPKL